MEECCAVYGGYYRRGDMSCIVRGCRVTCGLAVGCGQGVSWGRKWSSLNWVGVCVSAFFAMCEL